MAASFESLAEAFRDAPGVKEGKMFGMPCLKAASGKVFAGVWNDQVVVKLPSERVDELTASGRGAEFAPMAGRVMKDWVVLPGGADDRALAEEAHRFVAG